MKFNVLLNGNIIIETQFNGFNDKGYTLADKTAEFIAKTKGDEVTINFFELWGTFPFKNEVGATCSL